MAGLTSAFHLITCSTITVWLLAAPGAWSKRATGENEFVPWKLSTQRDEEAGAGCLRLTNFNREKLLTTTSPELYLTLERRNLLTEYSDLTDSLYDAKKGTLGVWKCSELSRTIYLRGYDVAFRAKGVSIHITKTGKKLKASKIQLCFVDRAEEPDYMPPDVYSDLKPLQFEKGSNCKGHGEDCKELGLLREGVYGQVYDSAPDLTSDKMTLPVGLLKFLDRKDLLFENMDLAAMVNTGDRTGFAAAQIVARLKDRFLAKGVKLYYAQKSFTREGKKEEWHHWFEYADVDVVGKEYSATIGHEDVEYPQKFLDMYEECKGGNTLALARHIARHSGQTKWGDCGDVAGATIREHSALPKCKCKADDEKVFCGDTVVASRKFDRDSVISLKACSERRAYCSRKACLPPDNRP